MVEVAIAGTQQIELVSISAEGKPEAESAAMIKRGPSRIAGMHSPWLGKTRLSRASIDLTP
jgi:hypothetical protein